MAVSTRYHSMKCYFITYEKFQLNNVNISERCDKPRPTYYHIFNGRRLVNKRFKMSSPIINEIYPELKEKPRFDRVWTLHSATKINWKNFKKKGSQLANGDIKHTQANIQAWKTWRGVQIA